MLYFVRHGETYNNAKNILGGDSSLNENGIIQAKQTAELLKDIHFDKLFISTLKRTRQTAEYINKYHNLEFNVDKRLNERFYGSYENTDERVLNFYSIWDLDNEVKLEGNIETIQEMADRVKSFLDEVSKKYHGKNILVVSHRGTGRIFQYLHKIIPPTRNLFTDGLNNGEFYTYDI